MHQLIAGKIFSAFNRTFVESLIVPFKIIYSILLMAVSFLWCSTSYASLFYPTTRTCVCVYVCV